MYVIHVIKKVQNINNSASTYTSQKNEIICTQFLLLYVDKIINSTTTIVIITVAQVIITVIIFGVEWNGTIPLHYSLPACYGDVEVLLMSCSIVTRNLKVTADQGIYFFDFILGMI